MLAGQSMEMPNELNCSSIRVNQEEEDPQLYTARNTLNAPYSKNKFFKQFEQNSINGLEGSLSVHIVVARCQQIKKKYWS